MPARQAKITPNRRVQSVCTSRPLGDDQPGLAADAVFAHARPLPRSRVVRPDFVIHHTLWTSQRSLTMTQANPPGPSQAHASCRCAFLAPR
jgi:hypothetical protein